MTIYDYDNFNGSDVDVTNTGNGSLGTSVQRQPSWEFKMAVKTKEKTRRETIWVNASFYRLCPQMASTFLQEQTPISTGINKACNGPWVENRIECQARVLNKSFLLSTTSIDTQKKCLPAIETRQVVGLDITRLSVLRWFHIGHI